MDVDKVWIMSGLCMDNPWIMYGCDIHILSILYPRLTFYGSTDCWKYYKTVRKRCRQALCALKGSGVRTAKCVQFTSVTCNFPKPAAE